MEMKLRREKTIDHHKAIKASGYGLVVMKECDKKLEANSELDLQLQSRLMLAISQLSPRDAFFGGTLYFKSYAETKMHYFDICSLCNESIRK